MAVGLRARTVVWQLIADVIDQHGTACICIVMIKQRGPARHQVSHIRDHVAGRIRATRARVADDRERAGLGNERCGRLCVRRVHLPSLNEGI